MKQFLKGMDTCPLPGSRVMRDLIYGWGNESFSALDEYIAACIEHALTSPGPILECGSGLSTILISAIAQRRGKSYWALEHDSVWAAKVQRYLTRYELGTVVLCVQPLKDYRDFYWYDVPLESMPDSFSLVVCDGPPGSTPGGRYGLVPIMGKRLQPDCVILLDDAGRENELAIAERWKTELGVSFEILGSVKPYIKMTATVGRQASAASSSRWQPPLPSHASGAS